MEHFGRLFCDVLIIKKFCLMFSQDSPLWLFLPGCEHRVNNSTPELAVCKDIQKAGVKELSDPCVPSGSVSEEPLRSPQLSDFGLQRYIISQVPANPPQTAASLKEERVAETPPAKDPSVQVLKTPRCALRMDDFECETPKLEHFGISEHTMCLNEDYTMGLKNMKNIKRLVTRGFYFFLRFIFMIF